MKPSSISAEALFEQHRTALRWQWLAGHAQPDRPFDESAVRQARSAAEQAAAALRLKAEQAAVQLGVADELERLADLRDRGILSDEEFQAQKSKLIEG